MLMCTFPRKDWSFENSGGKGNTDGVRNLLNMARDLKTHPITAEEQAMLARATSNKGFHYFGEGRFFILLGKSFADTMLELMGQENKVVPPKLQMFAPTSAK